MLHKYFCFNPSLNPTRGLLRTLFVDWWRGSWFDNR